MSRPDRVWPLSRTDAAPLVERRDSITNPVTMLGSPTSDKGALARPTLCPYPLSDPELRSLYGFNGIARRIIDLLPTRACRKGGSVAEVPMVAEKKLRLWSNIARAMKMARLYGGSALLMVTEDDVPAEFRNNARAWLREPLDLARVGQLQALHAFDAFEAGPIGFEGDIRSVSFREPGLWQIATSGFQAVVHSSRVVWFRGAERPPSEMQGGYGRSNRMPDDSVLQVVWDQIRNLTATMQGGAVLAAELHEAVLTVANLEAKQVGDEAADLATRIRGIQTGRGLTGLILLNEGDEYENRSNPPTGFNELSEAALTMLCTVLGWPRTMLTGEAPGGLSTDDGSGLERERQLISDYQEDSRDEIERLYEVILSAQDGPTGGVVPEEWSLEFQPLDEPSEPEIADLRAKVAETDAVYVGLGVYSAEHVARSRFGPDGWSIDLLPVEEPDPSEEEALQAALAETTAPVEGEPAATEPPASPNPGANTDPSVAAK